MGQPAHLDEVVGVEVVILGAGVFVAGDGWMVAVSCSSSSNSCGQLAIMVLASMRERRSAAIVARGCRRNRGLSYLQPVPVPARIGGSCR